MKSTTVFKLLLKKAIIIEDARRITKDVAPINNIRRLSQELERVYDEKYDADTVYPIIYIAQRNGHAPFVYNNNKNNINELIEDICTVTTT